MKKLEHFLFGSFTVIGVLLSLFLMFMVISTETARPKPDQAPYTLDGRNDKGFTLDITFAQWRVEGTDIVVTDYWERSSFGMTFAKGEKRIPIEWLIIDRRR